MVELLWQTDHVQEDMGSNHALAEIKQLEPSFRSKDVYY